MAAPSGTIWGSIVTGSKSTRKGRLGIYKGITETATSVTVNVQVWFWTMYSLYDENNTYYYNTASSATTSRGSVNISHSVSSGSGWSTSNQTRIGNYTYTYTKTTSTSTKYYSAKLIDIDILPGSITVSTSYTVPKLASYTVSYNANGGSGAPSSQTKWYGTTLTLSSTKPTRTGYSFLGWSTSSSATSATYSAGGSYTANSAATLYAVWKANTYTVSYNANGGSGAPSAQTKTYGKTLTLSSTKPSRTGYTFQGWATSASGSVAYAAGASYTANSAATLYAVWKANTYTVTFNANGGSGAPSAQTKTYGVTLKLSTTKPTRTNYTFQGWATSSTGGVAYASGANYTNNAAVTLYAVWKLAYKKPRVTSFSVDRCDSSGAAMEEGTYGLIKFNWATDYTVTSITIKYKLSTATSWTTAKTLTPGGTSGSVSQVIGGSLSTDSSYDILVTVTDSGGNTPKNSVLGGTQYVIDVMDGGRGIAFGKPAETADLFEVEYPAQFNHDVQGMVAGLGGLPSIPANSDLNNYITPGGYSVPNDNTGSTIVNRASFRAGRLYVMTGTGGSSASVSNSWAYLVQIYITYLAEVYIRYMYTTGTADAWTYGAWKTIIS